VIIIPWFLIPGRPFPIQVHLYACGLYSSTSTIGQRGAAESTRDKFHLEKFSHSTVSRSFRAFEQSRKQGLEQRFGKELKVFGTKIENLVTAAVQLNRVAEKEDKKAEKDEASNNARCFPTAADTSVRRKEMALFLKEFLTAMYDGHAEAVNIEAAARHFVENIYKKTRRLLL